MSERNLFYTQTRTLSFGRAVKNIPELSVEVSFSTIAERKYLATITV